MAETLNSGFSEIKRCPLIRAPTAARGVAFRQASSPCRQALQTTGGPQHHQTPSDIRPNHIIPIRGRRAGRVASVREPAPLAGQLASWSTPNQALRATERGQQTNKPRLREKREKSQNCSALRRLGRLNCGSPGAAVETTRPFRHPQTSHGAPPVSPPHPIPPRTQAKSGSLLRATHTQGRPRERIGEHPQQIPANSPRGSARNLAAPWRSPQATSGPANPRRGTMPQRRRPDHLLQHAITPRKNPLLIRRTGPIS
jgi:hypothetical protein